MSDGEIIVYIFWRKMNKLAGRHTAKETPALEESAEEGRGKGSEKKKRQEITLKARESAHLLSETQVGAG